MVSWPFKGHPRSLTLADLTHSTYLRIMANLSATVNTVSWGTETEYVANFSHGRVYSASLHYPVSISAIDPVCPQQIFLMRLTLFPSGTRYATNIPSINLIFFYKLQKNALSCWLNVEHAGENFMSLRLVVLEMYTCYNYVDFTKISHLAYHNCAKYWPRVKKKHITNRK